METKFRLGSESNKKFVIEQVIQVLIDAQEKIELKSTGSTSTQISVTLSSLPQQVMQLQGGNANTPVVISADKGIKYETVVKVMDSLQRDYRVTLAGPTTLLALLNSLHMGFRTLALEKQASEVWKVLGAVKTEFDRYGEWVAKVREQVQKAADTLDRADTRSKQMRRVLKGVEALPEAEALARLPLDALDTD